MVKLARYAIAIVVLVTLVGAGPALGGVIIQASEVGGDVVLDGSGTLDLSSCAYGSTGPMGGIVKPDAFGLVGPRLNDVDFYDCAAFSGPANFGPGTTEVKSDSGSGDVVGIRFGTQRVGGPPGYTSGNPLAGSSTWLGESFASLGMTPGSYVWSWGSGVNADSITLNVGPTPEVPALSGPLAMVLAGVLLAFGAFRVAGKVRRPTS